MVVMKVEKRKKARPWVGMGMRSGRGALVRLLIFGIRSNQQTPEVQGQMVWELLDAVWTTAIEETKGGDRVLLDELLAINEPVPPWAVQELQSLKGPRNRRSEFLPEDVVEAVQWAIMHDHPYKGGDDAQCNPAFVEAARLLGYHPGTVQRKWFEVPEERRREIRDAVRSHIEEWFQMSPEKRHEAVRLLDDLYGSTRQKMLRDT